MFHLRLTPSCFVIYVLVQVDEDGGGEIDYKEFGAKLGAVGQSAASGGFGFEAARAKPVEVARMQITRADMSVDRIMTMIKDKVEAKSGSVTKVFRGFDADKSGFVNYEEFRKGMNFLGLELKDSEFNALMLLVRPEPQKPAPVAFSAAAVSRAWCCGHACLT